MSRVIIVGAGPYGLSTAAFLRDAGVDVQVYGRVMEFWEAMPPGMYLRSEYAASNIGDPRQSLSLSAFERRTGHELPRPTPLADFIRYGHWFHEESGIPVDPRLVTRVALGDGGFAVTLEDGETVTAERVIVATGITPFPWRPPLYDELPEHLVSHTAVRHDYASFKGKSVAVVGAGQSALESAALLHEAGAETELLVRRPRIRFLKGEKLHNAPRVIANLLYPSWGVGPPGINWLMGRPVVFHAMPTGLRDRLAARAIKPAGASWVRARIEGVKVSYSLTVTAARAEGENVRLELDDGSERLLDHVLLGTGYRIDVRRYPFLDPALLEGIKITNGYPELSGSYESTVSGLHFVGAPAASSAGPGMRFVSHTAFTARALTRGVVRRP